MKRFPKVVKKVPNNVKKFPKVVKKLPNNVKKFPNNVEKFPKDLKKFPKVVKKFCPKSSSRANLSKMDQMKQTAQIHDVDQNSENLVEQIEQNGL